MNSGSVSKRNVRKPFLFEVAWEVANKVGGIYTVIKTKVPTTVQEYTQERYCLIGPLNHKHAQLEVEQIPLDSIPSPASSTNLMTPQQKPLADNNSKPHTPSIHPALKKSIEAMRMAGINVVFGKWLIESSPYVVLFDLNSARARLNEWKADLWSVAGIPSPEEDWEMNDAIIFGYLTAWFLGEFVHRNRKQAVIAHFHEWMASAGLILINKRGLDISTIFTTHATLLGRYLCAGSVDFYNHLHLFDVDYEAGRRGIYHRYCLERGAAHCADVFTTVSHVTAYEAENLLKRKPDGVLPNGLNVVKFSAMHEFQNLHARHKEKIHDFVRGHFFGHLNFDLDNTLYFFTSGRYEFRNKGVDMFLESLARVNQRLKHINSPITVVVFIIMPAPHHSFTVETLKGQAVMKQLRESVHNIQESIGSRLVEACAHGKLPNPSDLLSEEETILLKRRIFSLKRDTLPPVVTHNMANDSEDQILNTIRRLGMFNNREDRVKIVFHPEFLNSNNPLFNMDYDDFVRGCHLGVFPSYYEPWGYTPAECTVMGVPSITTNLSGFGCFMEEQIENPADYGIYIIDRRMKSVEESIQQLADTMLHFCHKSRRQRINQRNRVERLSEILDWQRMGLEYVKARRLAMRRKYPESFIAEDEWESEWHEDEEDDYMDANGPNTKSPALMRKASAQMIVPKQNMTSEPRKSLVTETLEQGIDSRLHTGKKIQEPFSAPGSPKLQALIDETTSGLRELMTGDNDDSSLIGSPLSESGIGSPVGSGSPAKKNNK